MKIIEDIKAYSGGSAAKVLSTILLNPYFHLCLWYRISHGLYRIHLGVIAKVLMVFHKIIFSCDIDYRCSIGGGLKILHGSGIVIGKDVVIGKNVSIYQGVTLGGNFGKTRDYEGKEIQFPIIGDNAMLLTKCTVIGPCVIGDGAVIGAHALIAKDVAPNCVAYCRQELIVKEKEEQ